MNAEAQPAQDGAPDAPSTCALCGREAEDPAAVMTWSLEVEGDGWRWVCPPCARDHIGDIEARLDVDAW